MKDQCEKRIVELSDALSLPPPRLSRHVFFFFGRGFVGTKRCRHGLGPFFITGVSLLFPLQKAKEKKKMRTNVYGTDGRDRGGGWLEGVGGVD